MKTLASAFIGLIYTTCVVMGLVYIAALLAGVTNGSMP